MARRRLHPSTVDEDARIAQHTAQVVRILADRHPHVPTLLMAARLLTDAQDDLNRRAADLDRVAVASATRTTDGPDT